MAEFDDLFRDCVVAVDRADATSVWFTLDGGDELAARVLELTARETECCSFFTFNLVPASDGQRLLVQVPPAQVAVLDALTTRAQMACAVTESGLRSGEVAHAAGVNVQTLRYYERRGLLHEPDRTLGGHRMYPPATVTVLRVIKAAQRLGFALDEVAELLEVSHLRAGQRTDAGLRARARVRLAEVDARLVELTTGA